MPYTLPMWALEGSKVSASALPERISAPALVTVSGSVTSLPTQPAIEKEAR